MKETNNNQVVTEKTASIFAEELVFEELEQRIVPELHGGCATSSSCSCSSSSCVVYS